MNTKEEFIVTLQERTEGKEQVWTMCKYYPQIEPYITNLTWVSQVFVSKMDEDEIFFIVQKSRKYNLDVENYETFSNFVLVINSVGELIYTVIEDEVSEYMLDALLNVIRRTFENKFYHRFRKIALATA